MGRHKKLGVCASRSTLFTEWMQETRMQEIFWLLDANEARRVRIVEQNEVSQHLERAIGRKTRQNRITEWRILDPQQ